MLKDKDGLDIVLAAVTLAYLAWLVYTLDERVKSCVHRVGHQAAESWREARWPERLRLMPGWRRELVNHRRPLPPPFLVQLSDHHIVYWRSILEE
jgi:hypothetical protein